ncbi:hypothetical protein IFR04_013879 [Cadophora malorum]|uniref:Uncharacterized protein n=1 Tax=Cadophora malorum TaxID=108018 RepID=A0A8H7T3V4_9HELO|nr:hypothetical protein IFR04_013879 [Cadophora malorum]
MEIDFAFDKASARPTQCRTAARKPLSTPHNFNSKQPIDTRKPRVRVADEVEVPTSFINFLDQQMNLVQLEKAISASNNVYTRINTSQSHAMFRFTGLDIQNLPTAEPNLSTLASMVKGRIRTRNYHLKLHEVILKWQPTWRPTLPKSSQLASRTYR